MSQPDSMVEPERNHVDATARVPTPDQAFTVALATLTMVVVSAFVSGWTSIWLIQLGCIGIPLLVLWWLSPVRVSLFGPRPPWVLVLIAIALGPCVVLLNIHVVVPLSPWTGTRAGGDALLASPLAILLISHAAVPALFEELLFRGVIVRSLHRFGQPVAIGVGAFAFAGFHFSLPALLPMLVVGIVAGLIMTPRGFTSAAIGFHLSNNATALFMLTL